MGQDVSHSPTLLHFLTSSMLFIDEQSTQNLQLNTYYWYFMLFSSWDPLLQSTIKASLKAIPTLSVSFFKSSTSCSALLQSPFFWECLEKIHAEPPTGDDEGHAPPMEDDCTLWSWLTFNWMNGFLFRRSRALEEKDLSSFSYERRSRILLQNFLAFHSLRIELPNQTSIKINPLQSPNPPKKGWKIKMEIAAPNMPPTNASMSSNMLSSILFASNRFISNGFKLLERRKRGKCGHHHSQTSCHQVFYPLSTACLLHKILFTTLWAQLLFSFCPLFRFLFPSFRSLPLSFAADCSYVPFLLTFHGVGDEQKR